MIVVGGELDKEQVSFDIYFGEEHLSVGKWGIRFKNNIYIYIYCRVSIWGVSFTVDVSEPKPNRPNIMNWVEKRV